MVTGQNQKIIRIIGIDKINVLRDRIRRTSVYIQVGIRFLTRRQYENTAVLRIKTPATSRCCIAVQENRPYCVSTPTMSMPLLAQLLSGKSMIRYLPPKETAGFATFFVRSLNRLPRQPAFIMASIVL